MLIDVVGYPSSAAAYCLGVEQAPRALRDAGLVERLEEQGHVVRDAGDLPVRRWRPDHMSPRAQNLGDEVEGLRGLVDVLSPLLTGYNGDRRFLVLGEAAPSRWASAARCARRASSPGWSTSTGTST